MSKYTATLLIKEKGSKNRVRLYSREFSERAVDNLKELFTEELIVDPSYRAKEEVLEAATKLQEKLTPTENE